MSLDESGYVIRDGLCSNGSYTSFYTGADGSYHWRCSHWCKDTPEDCWGNKYSCVGPVPANTVYVGEHWLLNSPWWYELYPDDSPHLWEPCSLKCAVGYKYVDGRCEKVNPPKCWEPNKGTWNWRSSPQYCQDVFPLGTSDYNNCMSKAYKYCDEWNLNDFSIWGFIGASWKCISWEDGVSREDDAECSASCIPWTDNYDPSYLYLGSTDSNSDSIFIRYGKTLDFTWWDTSWLSVSRTYAGWLSGYWMMRFTGSANTGSQRSTTITFTTNDDYFCDTWDLTIVQCQVGYKSQHKPEGGYVCVPEGTYSCSESDLPANSEPAWERFWFTVEPPSNKLYEDKEAAKEIPCSLVCKEGYTFLYAAWSQPDRCVKCEVWTLNSERTWCEVIVGCATWYEYDKEIWWCVVLGDCIVGYSPRTIAPDHSIGFVSYDESRPRWQSLGWSCLRNVEDIRPHSCEFACEEGYLCNGKFCELPVCTSFKASDYWDLSVAVTYENPTYEYAVSVGWWMSRYVPWKYQEASSLEEFNSIMYNPDGTKKKAGCWYWCNNGYVDRSGTYPKCINPVAPAAAYTCIGSLTGLRDTNIITTDKDVTFTDHNRDWRFIWPRSLYYELKEQGEQCLYTCKEGYDYKTFNIWNLCAMTCDYDTEYMAGQGFCLPCYVEDGYFPDHNNDDHWNALSCSFVCDTSTQIWSKSLKSCIANRYYDLKCPDWMTELDRTDEWKLICWVRFG